MSAAFAAESTSAKRPSERLSVLEDQIAKLEPLLEQVERNNVVSQALADYLADLRDEQKFLKGVRWSVAIFTCGFAFLLVLLLVLSVFDADSPLLEAGKTAPYAVALFVVGVVSGVVLLLSGLIKGVFRPAADRQAESILPAPVEEAMKLYERLRGGK
jgi:hypothetical protein